MVNSIIILAVIVLPGWISVSAAQRHRPRVFERTTLMVWGMMFYHAAVVHAIGVGTAAALALIWRGYFLDTLGLDRVLTEARWNSRGILRERRSPRSGRIFCGLS